MKIDLNKEQFEKIPDFLRRQWKIVGLTALILVSLIITLILPSRRDAQEVPRGGITESGSNSNNTPSPTDNPSSFLDSIFDREEDLSEISPTVTPPAYPANTINALTAQSTVSLINQDGTTTEEEVVAGSTINTAQGTITTNTNLEEDIESNEDEDRIAIVFQNDDGTTTTYIPPGTPPDEVRWARYVNETGGYEINYPFNWQFVYSVDQNGHEGVALYPPGVNKNDPRSPFVGFGLTQSFLLPAAGDTSNALITPIQVDGVPGDLYTNGPLGASYVASIFSYDGNYFGLGASKSDATFAYVYYYMLYSLTFTAN